MRVVCNNSKLRLRQSGRRAAWTSRLTRHILGRRGGLPGLRTHAGEG
jgi:hypothetical protein